MTGNELDSFVRKFINLWQSGWDAKLQVESEAGNAYVSLRVGLGHDLHGHQQVVHHRGGGPARQRRRERREAERNVNPAAEEAVVVKVESEETMDFEAEQAEKKHAKMTDQVNDIIDDRKANIELKVNAHEEQCSKNENDEKVDKKEEFSVFFSFRSKSSEEVIGDSLKLIFPPDKANDTTLVLREWLGPRTDIHLCTLKVQTTDKNIAWPTMEASLMDVFREARRL